MPLVIVPRECINTNYKLNVWQGVLDGIYFMVRSLLMCASHAWSARTEAGLMLRPMLQLTLG